jgi:creatinine amidohydrolase
MLHEYIHSRPGQLEAAIKECPLALVPVGSLEWHSLHLPLGFDGIKAEALLRQVGERIGKGVIFPCIFFGAYNTMGFPYTCHFPRRYLQKQIEMFVEQLFGMGFRVIVMINGHYPREQTQHFRKLALKMMKKYPDVRIFAGPECILTEDVGYLGDHAAKGESSLGLALFPNEADLSQLPDEPPEGRWRTLGIGGDNPKTTASREYGEQLVEKITNRLIHFIEETLKNGSQAEVLHYYDSREQRIEFVKSLK